MLEKCFVDQKDYNLYDEKSKDIMLAADNIPGMSSNRIELIKDFAIQLGAKSIGIANCVMFNHETQVISKYLSRFFKIFTVNCKYGSLTRKDLFSGNKGGSLCNPAAQAEYLNSKECDINISIGLCVGHDMIFNRLSAAPVTTLYTKDFTNNNNPDIAIQEIQRTL